MTIKQKPSEIHFAEIVIVLKARSFTGFEQFQEKTLAFLEALRNIGFDIKLTDTGFYILEPQNDVENVNGENNEL